MGAAHLLDSSMCRVGTLEALSAIHAPALSLALHTRAPLDEISAELADLPANAFPDVRAPLHAGNTRKDLVELIAAQGYDAEAVFPRWLTDMTRIAELFISLAGRRPVTARLETLAHVGCPRFHVDHSYLRLVCTYRGSGTEWLEDAQVNRAALASGAPNEAIGGFAEPNQMPTFAVGLMKGSRHPDCRNTGLVHRSPMLAPSERLRVLFCLDC